MTSPARDQAQQEALSELRLAYEKCNKLMDISIVDSFFDIMADEAHAVLGEMYLMGPEERLH